MRTVAALKQADIVCDDPEGSVQVSPGAHVRIWVSLKSHDDTGLAERVTAALAAGGLRLTPTVAAFEGTTVERLRRNEPLFVELDKSTADS